MGRVLGFIGAFVLTAVALRMARLDYYLGRVNFTGSICNWFTEDFLLSADDRLDAYRHPLSPNSPRFDFNRIIIKLILTISTCLLLSEGGLYWPVAACLIRVLCGILLLATGWAYDPYFP